MVNLLDRIRLDGGFTLDPTIPSAPLPSSGFFVSLGGGELSVLIDALTPSSVVAIVNVYADVAIPLLREKWATVLESFTTLLRDPPAAPRDVLVFVGAWLNDHRQVVFDATVHVSDRESALALGRLGKQSHVWDIAAGNAVPVPTDWRS